MAVLKAAALAVLIAMLTGCATWPTHLIAEEATFQVLNAADAYQTAEIRSRPGYCEREVDAFIGRRPKPASVAAWFSAAAIGHVVASALLQAKHPVATQLFERLTIGWSGADVAANWNIGLRF